MHLVPDWKKEQVVRIPGVVSVGETVENGKHKIIVRVHADADLPDTALPDYMGQYPVEVRVSYGYEPARRNGKIRPLAPGIGVSAKNDSGAGTLGPVLTDGEDHYLTTNWHVINDGDTSTLMQPPDAFRNAEPVGTKAGHAYAASGGNGYVDAAWYKVNDGVDYTNKLYESGAPVPTGTATVEPGDRLIKSSYITGTTEAVVRETGVTVFLPNERVYNRQITLDGRIEKGDSGSALIKPDTGEIVGVVFAGDMKEQKITANAIQNWERASGLSVATGDLTDGGSGGQTKHSVRLVATDASTGNAVNADVVLGSGTYEMPITLEFTQGEHTLVATHPDYQDTEKTVTVNSDMTVRFSMQPADDGKSGDSAPPKQTNKSLGMLALVGAALYGISQK